MSTLAVVKRETNSWRYPLLMAAYLFALAYVAAFITYRVTLCAREADAMLARPSSSRCSSLGCAVYASLDADAGGAHGAARRGACCGCRWPRGVAARLRRARAGGERLRLRRLRSRSHATPTGRRADRRSRRAAGFTAVAG